MDSRSALFVACHSDYMGPVSGEGVWYQSKNHIPAPAQLGSIGPSVCLPLINKKKHGVSQGAILLLDRPSSGTLRISYQELVA